MDNTTRMMVGMAEHDLELAVEVEGVFERGLAGLVAVDVDPGARRL